MRRGAALLLVAVFAVVAVAKGSADTPSSETNGDSSSAQSGLGKLEQHDQTNPNPNKEHVTHQKGGVSNDIGDNNKKDNSTEVTDITRDDSIPQPKDKENSTTKPPQVRDFMDDPLIKECDPSHRCIIENKKFIACLKVSGEDSSALSLLMDNRGVNALDVSITAPEHVTLAKDAIHVEANDHNETQVRVSVIDSNSTTIVLKVAESSCNISIHSAITRETGRAIRMPLKSTYTLLPIFLLLAVVGLCIMLRRTCKQDDGLAYQKVDVSDLPVSVGGKKAPDDQSDRWDDNWGDDWDDEEAPITPSKPLPNPSSKGLAPRRSTKDGWKD